MSFLVSPQYSAQVCVLGAGIRGAASGAVPMALERRLTAYKYINKSVPHPFQEAILWHDSGSNAIQFECAGDTTPWHGELRWAMLDQTIIRFDWMCTDNR